MTLLLLVALLIVVVLVAGYAWACQEPLRRDPERDALNEQMRVLSAAFNEAALTMRTMLIPAFNGASEAMRAVGEALGREEAP